MCLKNLHHKSDFLFLGYDNIVDISLPRNHIIRKEGENKTLEWLQWIRLYDSLHNIPSCCRVTMLFYKKKIANFIIIIMINIGGIRNTIRTAENHQDPSSYWHQSSSLKSSSAGGRDDEEEGLKTGSSTINRRLKRRQQQPQHAAAGTSAGDPRVIDLTSSGHQEKLVSDEQLDHQSVASMILTGGGAMNKPYFEAAWPQNVSVVLGQPIALKCRTRLLGDRMVCLLIIPFPINQ